MPRRPRPISRPPPRHISSTRVSYSESEKDSSSSDRASRDIEHEGASASSDIVELEDDVDADAPRMAQWVDEDELDADEAPDDAPPKSSTARDTNISNLQDDLFSLPMGALRRAQQVLNRVNNDSGQDSSESESESNIDTQSETGGEIKLKQEKSVKSRAEIGKRRNKHAPIEVTSKKPVTRRRTVVDVKTPQARDPRFSSLTGEFSSQKFFNNYHFLVDAHKNELSTLRESLKRARKALASSPRDTRQEREAEVHRLELAVKRTESTVNKDRREQVEQEALQTVKKQEREKRESGKGNWWMKDSEKKKILMKARYDALAAQGGQKAVKKAIEKKQKKIGQKEKKSRPFAKGSFSEDKALKRPLDSGRDKFKPEKRRKLG